MTYVPESTSSARALLCFSQITNSKTIEEERGTSAKHTRICVVDSFPGLSHEQVTRHISPSRWPGDERGGSLPSRFRTSSADDARHGVRAIARRRGQARFRRSRQAQLGCTVQRRGGGEVSLSTSSGGAAFSSIQKRAEDREGCGRPFTTSASGSVGEERFSRGLGPENSYPQTEKESLHTIDTIKGG